MAKLADLKVNEMNCCQIDSVLVLQNALLKKRKHHLNIGRNKPFIGPAAVN